MLIQRRCNRTSFPSPATSGGGGDGERTEGGVVSLKSLKRHAVDLFHAGRFAESIDAFTQAIGLVTAGAMDSSLISSSSDNPLSPHSMVFEEELSQLYFRRACACMRMKDFRSAISGLECAISLNPKAATYHLQKGLALQQLHQFSEAGECFLAGLKIAPHNSELQKRFETSIEGTRLNWLQFCPAAFSSPHTAHTSSAGGNNMNLNLLHSLAAGCANDACGTIDPRKALEDGRIRRVLRDVGATLNIVDLLEKERAYWSCNDLEDLVNFDAQQQRTEVVNMLLDFKTVLRPLFITYCQVDVWTGGAGGRGELDRVRNRVRNRVSRRGSLGSGTGSSSSVAALSAALHVASADGNNSVSLRTEPSSAGMGMRDVVGLPMNTRFQMSEAQFEVFVTDCHILTQRFTKDRVAEALAQTYAAEAAIEEEEKREDCEKRALAMTMSLFGGGGGEGRGSGGEASPSSPAPPGGYTVAPSPRSRRWVRNAPSSDTPAAPIRPPLIFPKFVEALLRLAMMRYCPAVPPTEENGSEALNFPMTNLLSGGDPDDAVSVSGSDYSRLSVSRPASRDDGSLASGGGRLLGGGRQSMSMRRLGQARQRGASSRTLLVGGGETPHGGGGAGGAVIAESSNVPLFAERLRFAVETHLLSNPHANSSKTLFRDGRDVSPRCSARASGELLSAARSAQKAVAAAQEKRDVAEVLRCFKPRLRKIFAHFAARDPRHESMDSREFLYMMQELAILDEHTLPLEEACLVCVAVLGFIGDAERDQLSFDEFVDALAECCQVRSYDGVLSQSRRLENFLVNDLFRKVQARTRIAALW